MMSSMRSKNQKPAEKLNGGWEKYKDPDSGFDYYYNPATDESTYERPLGFSTSANPFASVRGGGNPNMSAAMMSSKRSKNQKPVEVLNGGWEKYKDPESDYDYYYHP